MSNTAYHIAPPSQTALAGQAGTTEGSTTAFSPAPPPVVPRKLNTEYLTPAVPVDGLSFGAPYSATIPNSPFGQHIAADGAQGWLCDPGQGPMPLQASNCNRVATEGARGAQSGMEYGSMPAHGAVSCKSVQYPAAFPGASCQHIPGFITATNTPAQQLGYPGSEITTPDSIATATEDKGGPTKEHWRVPNLAPTPPSQIALKNSQTTGIAPDGACNSGPTTSAFIPQDGQLPLTCHTNQAASSAGWAIHGAVSPTSATLKNYHWYSHGTFTPGVTAYPNKQWFASPCATPVYRHAYCLSPDRVLLGGATGALPGEMAQPGAWADASYVGPIVAAGRL